MTGTPRPRGRPKGTGIDDRETLRSVMSLLGSDIGLRPTTAIRQLGISDPSVVRRLREKLKTTDAPASTAERVPGQSSQPQRQRQPEKQNPVPPISSNVQRPAPLPSEIPAPQEAASQESAPAISPTSSPAGAANPASQPSSPIGPAAAADKSPLADPQLEALRLAAEAAGAMSRLYLHCMSYAAQTNPFSLALRSQSVMSDFMVTLLQGQPPR